MATTTTKKKAFHVKHSAFSAETRRRGTGSRRGMKTERIEVVVVVFRLGVFPPLFCEDFDFIRIIMNIGEAPLKYFCLVGNK